MTCLACSCPECVETHGPPIPEGAETPTPEELIAMLEARGWSTTRDRSIDPFWTSLVLEVGRNFVAVFVPMRRDAPDYRRAARTLLAEAAAVEAATGEDVSPQVLLDAVLARRATQ